jgi:KDO2-lipid IV(A) lauroyltransferase
MKGSYFERAAVPPVPPWLRVLSRLPWRPLYAVAAGLSWLIHGVFRYRVGVVRSNIAYAFPSLPKRELAKIEHGFYRYLSELLVEVIKSASMTPADIRARVKLCNVELVRDELDAGRSVLILAAHQGNWEWLIHALALDLRQPVDAAYKPLKGAGERIMRSLRSRFGGRLVPAKELLADIVAKRGEVHAVAMLADQEPFTAELKWWTQFLDRPTAFFMGPEKIARSTRFPVIFAGVRRLSRGHYEVHFAPIAKSREPFQHGAITERYARLVEAEIRANPAYWVWSHRRWRLRQEEPAAESATPQAETTKPAER